MVSIFLSDTSRVNNGTLDKSMHSMTDPTKVIDSTLEDWNAKSPMFWTPLKWNVHYIHEWQCIYDLILTHWKPPFSILTWTPFRNCRSSRPLWDDHGSNTQILTTYNSRLPGEGYGSQGCRVSKGTVPEETHRPNAAMVILVLHIVLHCSMNYWRHKYNSWCGWLLTHGRSLWTRMLRRQMIRLRESRPL